MRRTATVGADASLPRMIKGTEMKFLDGPQSFSKHFVEPVDGMTQTLHVHLDVKTCRYKLTRNEHDAAPQ